MASKTITRRQCPKCDSKKIEEYSGEYSCIECGHVLGRRIEEKEYTEYNAEETQKKKRVGGSVSFSSQTQGIGSTIGNNKDMMSGEKRVKYKRMQKWMNRDKYSGTLNKYFTKIEKLCEMLGLDYRVQEEAARIVRKMYENELTKGKGRSSTASAAVYISSKRNNCPRLVDEIAEESEADKADIKHMYKKVVREFELQLQPVSASDIFERYAGDVDIRDEQRRMAKDIVRMCEQSHLFVGRQPTTGIAGAVYLAGNSGRGKITQFEVAEAVGVTEVSVRDMKSSILDELGDDLPFEQS